MMNQDAQPAVGTVRPQTSGLEGFDCYCLALGVVKE
jgi:hypothetical protein